MEVGSGPRMESIIRTPTIQTTQDHDRGQVPRNKKTDDLELANLPDLFILRRLEILNATAEIDARHP